MGAESSTESCLEPMWHHCSREEVHAGSHIAPGTQAAAAQHCFESPAATRLHLDLGPHSPCLFTSPHPQWHPGSTRPVYHHAHVPRSSNAWKKSQDTSHWHPNKLPGGPRISPPGPTNTSVHLYHPGAERQTWLACCHHHWGLRSRPPVIPIPSKASLQSPLITVA